MMNGLQSINIELTSRCNKSCHMCGRRKLEKEHPELCDWGDMPLDMLRRIAEQIPKGVFVQLHNNGEPLLYPHFDEALEMFDGHYVGLNTNGKLLMEQAEPICKYLSTITISIIEKDCPEEWENQIVIVRRFLDIENRPLVILRLLGKVNEMQRAIIKDFRTIYSKLLIAKRILHSPDGSHDYEKPVTKPEIGICLEMLHKLAIDRWGNVFPCVRFDPHHKNYIDNVHCFPLKNIWNDEKRQQWIEHHINGRRDLVPLCKTCDFWGVPRG